jgi:hypothetical protein
VPHNDPVHQAAAFRLSLIKMSAASVERWLGALRDR